MATAAWDRQLGHLLEDSPFAARKLREAGVGPRGVDLADIAKLPLSTKEELKAAIDEAPPFGSNASVPPERVKRIYQTSGTSGAPSVIALSATDVETWTAIGTRTYYATGIHDHHAVLSTFAAGPFVAGHTHFVLTRITTKRLRRRTFSVPGSLTRSRRQIFLHLPSHWPWAAAFLEALKRRRLIRTPLVT